MQRETTIEGNTIVGLPLKGRNGTQLQQLEPGVQMSSDHAFFSYQGLRATQPQEFSAPTVFSAAEPAATFPPPQGHLHLAETRHFRW